MKFGSDRGSVLVEYVLAAGLLLTASLILYPALQRIANGLTANLGKVLSIPTL